VMNTE
jgi:hypothetical protein